MNTRPREIAGLIGRALLIGIFGLSTINKITNFGGAQEYMAANGMFLTGFFLPGAIVFLLAGSIMVLLGWRTAIGATLLMIFLFPATLIFHDFWTLEGQEAQLQMIMFLKNVSMFGGLLFVAAYGPGQLSLDARRAAAS